MFCLFVLLKTRLIPSSSTKPRRAFVADEWQECGTLPGWKYKSHVGGNYKTGKIFRSPEGNNFKGKSRVMKFMLNNNYSSENILALREFFKIDGWETHEDLPQDWMWCQPGRDKALRLLSPCGNMFKSKVSAMNFIKGMASGSSHSEAETITNFNPQAKARPRRVKSKTSIILDHP